MDSKILKSILRMQQMFDKTYGPLLRHYEHWPKVTELFEKYPIFNNSHRFQSIVDNMKLNNLPRYQTLFNNPAFEKLLRYRIMPDNPAPDNIFMAQRIVNELGLPDALSYRINKAFASLLAVGAGGMRVSFHLTNRLGLQSKAIKVKKTSSTSTPKKSAIFLAKP